MAEKIVASDPSFGYVSKESRAPRRASGTFVPPVEGHSTTIALSAREKAASVEFEQLYDDLAVSLVKD